jgi:hypothetical protein
MQSSPNAIGPGPTTPVTPDMAMSSACAPTVATTSVSGRATATHETVCVTVTSRPVRRRRSPLWQEIQSRNAGPERVSCQCPTAPTIANERRRTGRIPRYGPSSCPAGSALVHAVWRTGRHGPSWTPQYWAYYPGSDTRIYGDSGFHHDDWESEQLRLGAAGAQARASSHHGYNYVGGASNWLSDAGITHRSAWGPDQRRYYVSGGSHAGHATESAPDPYRWTPGDAVRLVPLEPIAAAQPDTEFAITPPWRKRVWTDPEYTGTD